jgi:hypothetical protein
MMCGEHAGPVKTRLDRVVERLVPEEFSETELETLVQTITDQILASA